jgi:CarboxypepD_reg-like domain
MEFVEIRHRVVIAGQVTEARTGRALGGAQVLIASAPTAFVAPLVTAAKLRKITDAAMAEAQATLNNPRATNVQRLQAAQTILDFLQARGVFMPRRPDRTQAAADGLFFFVDLPAGAYTLTASLVGVSTRYGRGQTTATVPSSNGDRALATADIAIPSTTIRGQITGPSLDGDGSAPVAMAAVQVRGSGELTYSDSTGNYLLAGLERGTRVLTFAAQGYQTREQTMTFSEAGGEQVLNVILTLPP